MSPYIVKSFSSLYLIASEKARPNTWLNSPAIKKISTMIKVAGAGSRNSFIRNRTVITNAAVSMILRLFVFTCEKQFLPITVQIIFLS